MDGGDARLFEFFRHAQIEIGRVDADKDIRFDADEVVYQPFADFQDFGQAFDHFDEAAHRQFFLVVQALKPFRPHAFTADADEFRIGAALFDGADKVCAEQVAGGFADADGDNGGMVHIRNVRVKGRGILTKKQAGLERRA